MKQITEREVANALKKNRVWDLGNKVLYDLCSSNPHHKTDQEIIAKIWLIGRSYAAAIERRKNKSATSQGDKFYEKEVGPKIRNAKIDKWFVRLGKKQTPADAIEIHDRLTKLFYDISEMEKRSLASKYLHFHFKNVFFIYDKRSVSAIALVTPSSEKELGEFSSKNLSLKKFDKAYAKFFRRCLWLQEDLRKPFGRKPSPRELDKVLLYITDSRKP